MIRLNRIISRKSQARNLFYGGILFCSLLIGACTKPLRVQWVDYLETQCADKWEYHRNNEVLKENIITYCKSKGIKIFEIEIFSDRTPDACIDCNCKTGRRIHCKIRKSDLTDIKNEGFYE